MAISDRISAMYDHVGDIYDTLELGGDTTQNKNIVNINTEIKREYKDFLAHGVDVLWNNWEKVIGEGTQLSLTPTIKGKMKVDLKGNTQQNGTNGNQLSHGTLTPSSSSDNVSYSDNCIINFNNNVNAPLEINLNQRSLSDVLNIPTGVNTIYMKLVKISGTCTANYQLIIKHIDGTNVSGTSRNGSIASVNVADLNLESDRFQIYFYGTDTSISSGAKFQIVISKDSNCNWEKYTGGQPSPNPDYPQDIQVVSGDNTLKVEGKNLFDINTISVNTYLSTGNGTTGSTNKTNTSDWIQIQDNINYTLSYNYETLIDSVYRSACFYDKNKNYLGYRPINHEPKINTLTPYENSAYMRFSYDKNIVDIQLVKGNTAPTTYTPYVSQTYPISLGNIELCKIGDYQDSIVKDNGKWYLNKQIGKVVLNGSESWTKFDVAQGTLFRNVTKIINDINDNSYTPYSNYYKCIPFSQKDNRTNFNLYIGSIDDTLDIMDNRFTTASDFETWLSTHNTEVYYVLATPTYEEITDTTLLSQLEAIKYSYDSQTNISQTNADLPFVLDITALKEI